MLLGAIHILLMMLYCNEQQSTTLKDGASLWQNAFTQGEWVAVSNFMTSLIGEYYAGILSPLLLYNSKGEGEDVAIVSNSTLSIHLVVAHAGVVGCLFGVAVCSFGMSILYSSVTKNSIGTIGMMVASLATAVGVTTGCVELALKSRLSSSVVDMNVLTSNVDGSNVWMPLSIQWLFDFLTSEIGTPIHNGSVSRMMELGFWATVLAVCLPMTSKLMAWIASNEEKIVAHTNKNHHGGSIHKRKKRIIIARKYFHLIAILLFTPITWLDPDMMSLSYAIAVALLVVLEMIRGLIDEDTAASSWNDMYMTFLDDKDTSAAKGGLAVTHIALIVGCAFPLWVIQLLHKTSSSQSTMLILLPFLGVLVLGIGDSAGALGGIMFGRHRWPGGSSRTVEGSVCMFLSMMIIVVLVMGIQVNNYIMASVVMGLITLIEATTSQIDNLVLPIAGSTLILLITTTGE